jgi:hypothetical protein
MKQLALASFLAATALVGCTNYDTPNHGRGVSLEPSHNFLGIIKVEPASYANNDLKPGVTLSTNELFSRRNNTGDRITFLWGAFTLTDY